MPRAAAGRNAHFHRGGQAAGAALGQRVQVGNVGGFQLRLAGVGMGHSAQSIGYQQDNFGRRAGKAVLNLFKVNHVGSESDA